MASISIELDGASEAARALAQLARSSESRAKRAVLATALDAERIAKRRCPVDTGRLRASIHTRQIDGGLGAEVLTDVYYAVYQEYGTRYMSAQPYMRPAAEAVKDDYERRLRKALSELAT